jgi:hypothetical protein
MLIYYIRRMTVLAAFVLLALIACAAAYAATAVDETGSGGSIDFSPLITAFVSFAGVAIPAIGIWLSTLIKQKLKLDASSADSLLIDNAVQRAGGLAYNTMVELAGTVPTIPLKNAALAAGINHVMASIPDALARKGLDNATLTRMVTGELGKLLASDPSVSVAPPAAALQGVAQDPPVQGAPPAATPVQGAPGAPLATVSQGIAHVSQSDTRAPIPVAAVGTPPPPPPPPAAPAGPLVTTKQQ